MTLRFLTLIALVIVWAYGQILRKPISSVILGQPNLIFSFIYWARNELFIMLFDRRLNKMRRRFNFIPKRKRNLRMVYRWLIQGKVLFFGEWLFSILFRHFFDLFWLLNRNKVISFILIFSDWRFIKMIRALRIPKHNTFFFGFLFIRKEIRLIFHRAIVKTILLITRQKSFLSFDLTYLSFQFRLFFFNILLQNFSCHKTSKHLLNFDCRLVLHMTSPLIHIPNFTHYWILITIDD